MAQITLKVSDRFSPGTSISAYQGNLTEAQAGQAPSGTAVSSGTVGNDGTVALSGLMYATEYVAGALVSGRWRYVNFTVPPLPTEDTFAGLQDVDPGALTDGYTLGFSGGKIIGKRASGWFDASDYAGGTNGAAGQIAQAIADATAAITATRGATAYIPAGLWDCSGGGSITGAVAAIPRALSSGLRILFDTGAVVRLSANIPRLFDFNKIADYDTFQHILIDGNGMTLDANLIGGQHHCALGTYIAGAHQTRININDVLARGVNIVNLLRDPNTGVNHRLGFWISVNHPAAGETQTSLTKIIYRDCTVAGGNGGFAVNGNGTGAINVFHDEILYENLKWDSGVAPTAHFGSTGFHVGGSGFGNRCRLVNCHGFNAGDDAYEIDSMDSAILEDCTGTNSFSEDFFLTNATQLSPSGPDGQWAVLRNCRAFKIDAPGSANSNGFLFGDDIYEYGRIHLDTCRRYIHRLSSETTWNAGGLGIQADQVLVRELVVKNFTYEEVGIAHTDAASSDPSAIRINLLSSRARLELDARVHIQGNRGGTGTVRFRAAHVDGTDLRADVRVRFDNEVTGFSASSVRGIAIGDLVGTGSVRGKFSLVIERWASDSTPRGIWSDTGYSVPDKLVIEHSDFAALAGLAGNDVYHVATPGQQAKIIYGPGNRWRGGILAPATFTVTASPFVHQNLGGSRKDVYISGGTVTLVERSRTGAFAGEQINVGVTSGQVTMDNGDYLRVTYTAAPTMTAVPQA